MKTAFRTLLGIAVGLALAFGLVVALELASAMIHPLPADFDGTMEEMCAHVARYPDWVLGVVVAAWSATAFVAAWTATRLGSARAGIPVVLLLALAISYNVTMLPYATWFKVAMPTCFPVACCLGVLGGLPRPKPADEPKAANG